MFNFNKMRKPVEKKNWLKAKGIKRLNGPDVNLFGDNAPVSMVIIGGKNVQILDVLVDELVKFTLSEYMVVAVERDGSSPIIRWQ